MTDAASPLTLQQRRRLYSLALRDAATWLDYARQMERKGDYLASVNTVLGARTALGQAMSFRPTVEDEA